MGPHQVLQTEVTMSPSSFPAFSDRPLPPPQQGTTLGQAQVRSKTLPAS